MARGLAGLFAAAMLVFATSSLAQMSATGLVDALNTRLGVGDQQAWSGAGAVLRLAQERLPPAEFSIIEDAVPGVRDLLAAAPAVDASGGGLAPLAESFVLLGMSPELVPQFAESVIGYVRSGGGEPVAGLLERALLGR